MQITHYTGPWMPDCLNMQNVTNKYKYYIPINDTSFELPVFWPSDTESQINELRFSDSITIL